MNLEGISGWMDGDGSFGGESKNGAIWSDRGGFCLFVAYLHACL